MIASGLCTRELATRPLHGYALRMQTTLAQNILALRNHLGLTQVSFAEKVGVPQSYISKWEKLNKVPETASLETLAELARTSTRRFRDEPWAPGSETTEIKSLAIDKAPDRLPTRSASLGETVEITVLDLSVSMGPGAEIEDFVESEPVQFDLGQLRSITRTHSDRLRMIQGIGNSMEPVLRTGDRILVDINDRALSRLDGYYWITLHGAHGLKRLRPAKAGRILIVSENPQHEPIEVDAEDVTIEGRAIWFARAL